MTLGYLLQELKKLNEKELETEFYVYDNYEEEYYYVRSLKKEHDQDTGEETLVPII